MSGLSPEERQRRIEEIYRLAQSLRQPAPGMQIWGCREALVPLLAIVILLLLGYVYFSLSGEVRAFLLGILLFISVMFLVVALATRAIR